MCVSDDTSLLADVFDNFQNICLGIISCSFSFCNWLAALKKTKVQLDLLINIDMLLMVEKGIRGGIHHAIHQYAKTNNNYKNDYAWLDPLCIDYYINLFGCSMPQVGADVQHHEEQFDFHRFLSFFQKEWKLKDEKPVANWHYNK